MDKCFIKEGLINSYETTFDNHSITINEYSPCFTEEDKTVNEVKTKSLLAKVFESSE